MTVLQELFCADKMVQITCNLNYHTSRGHCKYSWARLYCMQGTAYFPSVQMTVITAEEYVMVNSEKLIGTTKYMMLQARCYTNWCL